MGRENVSVSTLTKADLVDQVYEQLGFSKKEAADLVETVFETMKKELVSGEKLKISGFGNFIVREKRERMGRNPQTGEKMKIEARRVVGFRPSQILKAQINGESVDGLSDDVVTGDEGDGE